MNGMLNMGLLKSIIKEGIHLGEFDPHTWIETKPANAQRKIEPWVAMKIQHLMWHENLNGVRSPLYHYEGTEAIEKVKQLSGI